MARILILFAHPLLEKSRVHARLLQVARQIEGVTINDLYEHYPDFDIDVKQEQKLLLEHDIIIWQHPFYWYSAPPLLKQWQDLVLEHGWAYGRQGTALKGKKIFNVFTSGAGEESYRHGGFNLYPIQEYLRPFERTATLCRMIYWPPFWVAGAHGMTEEGIQEACKAYGNMLQALSRDIFSAEEIGQHTFMNERFPTNLTRQ